MIGEQRNSVCGSFVAVKVIANEKTHAALAIDSSSNGAIIQGSCCKLGPAGSQRSEIPALSADRPARVTKVNVPRAFAFLRPQGPPFVAVLVAYWGGRTTYCSVFLLPECTWEAGFGKFLDWRRIGSAACDLRGSSTLTCRFDVRAHTVPVAHRAKSTWHI